MIEDAELLRRYAEDRSEGAFAELVKRRVGLVYSVAVRQCGGDAQLAEDVTQKVFTDLARKAGELAARPVLSGWLYRSAQFAASDVVRSERRRRAREEANALMDESTVGNADAGTAADWEKLRPVLDEALAELGEQDRDAVALRFLEEKSFAEIGRRLELSEDAVRKRVSRAVEKLQGLLARRGVTSTEAALALVLANQAAATVPAGLAASVTSGALAGGGFAAAAGFSILTLMSTTKFTGGMVAVAVMLGASLTANAYLWFRPVSAETGSAPTAVVAPPAAVAAPVVTELVKHADIAALRDQLRAAGASDAAIRAALEGILRRRYREQLSADRAARLGRGWWRDSQRTWGTANDVQLPFDDLRLINAMVTRPLEQLLGVDPLDEAETEARYGFLPEPLRREFGRLARASIGGWTRSGDPETDAVIEAEMEQNWRAVTEKREELMAALTPGQRADYEMRFGQFASGLARQLEQLAVTEQEFRAIFPIADRYAKESGTVAKRDDPGAVKAELDRRTAQQLIAALGYDRALDYIWAGSSEFPAYARVAREANLPPATAGRVVQLAAETADRAAAVHADATLTAEQKRAALLALQQTVRPQLDALVPTAAQQRLASAALAWINGLGEGRYKTIQTVLPGQVRSTVFGGVRGVDTPLPSGGTAPATPLVSPRPPGS